MPIAIPVMLLHICLLYTSFLKLLKKEEFMDKNNEQKNNKTPEMKPKQDSFLSLIHILH